MNGNRRGWARSLVFLLAACGTPQQHEPRETVQVPAPSPVADEPATDEEEPAEPAPDELYFLLRGGADESGGLVRLDSDGRFVPMRDSGRGLAVAYDGSLYLGGRAVHRWSRADVVSGGSPQRISVDRTITSGATGVYRLAVEEGGSFWALGWGGAGRHDGSTWTVTGRAELDGTPIRDVAVDREGAVRLLTHGAVFSRSGSEWERVAVPALDHGSFRHFVRTPDRTIAVSYPGGLLRQEDGEWTHVELVDSTSSDDPFVGDVVYRADGTLIAARGGGPGSPRARLLVVPPSGARRHVDLERFDVPATSITALEADGQGRLWASTDVGIVVLDRALGALLRWYPAGSVPELRGGVRGMVALGDGPSLPPVGPVQGRVTGRVLRRGSPLAGAQVEMCVDPYRSGWDESGFGPCEARPTDTPYVALATTDEDGRFLIWDVPAGEYALAVQLGPTRYFVTPEGLCCTEMQSGRTFEIRPIDVGSP